MWKYTLMTIYTSVVCTYCINHTYMTLHVTEYPLHISLLNECLYLCVIYIYVHVHISSLWIYVYPIAWNFYITTQIYDQIH